LRYNLSDTDGTLSIGLKRASRLNLPRALFRGRYDQACGVIEYYGVPLDADWWERFARVRRPLLLRLVKELDQFQIFDELVFKQERFARLLAALGISWERTESGYCSKTTMSAIKPNFTRQYYAPPTATQKSTLF
jgi:hypothetical protein